MSVEIRDERTEDIQTIRQITEAAFRLNAHSSGTEGAIIEALRKAGALTVSLVAIIDDELVGHAAFSPVCIDGQDLGWFGLGPVSVRPDFHKTGIGSVLIREGLERLKQDGAKGCVVLGAPAYYHRFGYENDPALRYEGAPADHFMRLRLDAAAAMPEGCVTYHAGFDAS
jgi:putative acetyltransferase